MLKSMYKRQDGVAEVDINNSSTVPSERNSICGIPGERIRKQQEDL